MPKLIRFAGSRVDKADHRVASRLRTNADRHIFHPFELEPEELVGHGRMLDFGEVVEHEFKRRFDRVIGAAHPQPAVDFERVSPSSITGADCFDCLTTPDVTVVFFARVEQSSAAPPSFEAVPELLPLPAQSNVQP